MSQFESPSAPGPGPTRNRPHANLTVLRVVVVLLFAVLAVRLASLQLVQGADFAQRAEQNHLRARNILPPRGLIFDRNGELLVENVPVYSATIIPEFLPDSEDERRAIYLWLEDELNTPALQVSTQVENAEAADRGGQALTVKEQLSEREALLVEEASVRLPGLELGIAAGRQYIGGPYFSHLLGYIGPQTAEEYEFLADEGYQLNELVGKAGLESRYESDLRGEPGAQITEADAFGHVLSVIETTDPEPGQSLRLSINAELQTFVGELLEATRGESPVAAAVVMDAQTGAILSLVSIPTYDNNLFADPDRQAEFETLLGDPRRPLINHALTPSAPGSTFKLVTASAALEYGNITPNTPWDVPSAVLAVKGENGVVYAMRDWRAHGHLSGVRAAIAWSSNIYFYMASCGILGDPNIRGLGDDVEEAAVRLGFYARSFGFGQATGIDLDAAEEDGVI
ncbi:MAG: penicillin-binding transpeptidase domain-containing protein, partial [Dehalococcoidia bacterium]